MMKRVLSATLIFATGFFVGAFMRPESIAHAQGNRVFEVRTYTTPEGKLDALKSRFRDNTIRIFNRHNMTSIGYWTPQDAPLSQNTLIYILAHPSREEAKKNWDAFRADPEWVKVKAASEANGPLTTKVESVFVNPTDFSPIK
jgi:NIPSNAP protein